MRNLDKVYCKKEYYATGEIRRRVYFLQDKTHRLKKPAFIGYYKSGGIEIEMYFHDDDCHRWMKPAIIKYDESGNIEKEEYWINGVCIDDWIKEMEINLPFSCENQVLVKMTWCL